MAVEFQDFNPVSYQVPKLLWTLCQSASENDGSQASLVRSNCYTDCY